MVQNKSPTPLVKKITLLGDLCHSQLCRTPCTLWGAGLSVESLRRAAQFVLVTLLITSLGAPAAICCGRCAKETVDQKMAPSPFDHCSHHMSHPPLGRRIETVTRGATCHACSRVSQSPSRTLITTNPTPGLSLTDGESSAGDAVLVASPPRLPESPPPLKSGSKRAVICTFLI